MALPPEKAASLPELRTLGLLRAHPSWLTPRKAAGAGLVLGLPTRTLAGLVKTSFMYSATVMGPVALILYIRCRSIGVTWVSAGSLPELKYFPLQRQGMTTKNK